MAIQKIVPSKECGGWGHWSLSHLSSAVHGLHSLPSDGRHVPPSCYGNKHSRSSTQKEKLVTQSHSFGGFHCFGPTVKQGIVLPSLTWSKVTHFRPEAGEGRGSRSSRSPSPKDLPVGCAWSSFSFWKHPSAYDLEGSFKTSTVVVGHSSDNCSSLGPNFVFL